MIHGPKFVPVLMRFPGELAREDGWGRFVELTAKAALLCSQTPLHDLEKVLLSFELHGERFRSLPALVESAQTDQDGYCLAELRFTDEVEKRKLARVLIDLLAR